MVSPKPVSLTYAATNPASNQGDPEPLEVIGALPSGAFPVTALTAVPALADTAAVKTYLDTLVGQLKGSPYFS